MKLPIRLASVFAALSVTMTATAFELVHSEGTINLPTLSTQIATFDLAVLDTLNTLDIAVAGVPKSTYQGSLIKFADTPVIGTLFEPDYPALEKLNPDLIFAGRRSANQLPKLTEIAPTAIFHSDPSAFLDSFRRSNLELAKAFDKKDLAEKAIDAIDHDVQALRTANKGKTAAMLFIIKDTIIPHAPGDSFGYAYELTGLDSVLPAKDPKTAAAPRPEPGSPEAKAAKAARAEAIKSVSAAEPDWLIVLDRGAINNGEKTAADSLAKHPLLSQTQAFKEGRIYYADPNAWYIIGGGLTNLKTITGNMLAKMN